MQPGRKAFEMSLNTGIKAKENHESWESLFRKTMSKEPLFSFTKPAEKPIHWIHFLETLDQQDTGKGSKGMNAGGGHKNVSATLSNQSSNLSTTNSKGSLKGVEVSGERLPPLKIPDAVATLAQVATKASDESIFGGSTDLPGWPLMPFSKVQMFKCEKCCLEFCSPMNHRRHLRMIHRRPVNSEKEDPSTQRQQLATFWDNLCPEAAHDIVARKNLALEDLTGEPVIRALTHLLQKPILFALPQSYVKAGAVLLELIQNKSSRLLITSSELFKILDGSSERTFPSFGLGAMHRYVFEGGAGKVGLEIKNLVASLGFLVEHNLVKAFINNKDEEALRCQTALVEEEVASQRKQAEAKMRKQLKKVRQKESRDKELKPLDSAMGLSSSHGCLTVEGNSPSEERDDFVYGLQSGLLSNTYENLYHRLASEESDTDFEKEIVSTEPSNRCKDNDHSVDYLEDAVITGMAAEDSKSGSKKSAKIIAREEGNFADATYVQKPGVEQKRKYSSDYSLSSKGRFMPVQKYKESWKERKWMDSSNFRNFLKESHAVDTNEKSPGMNLEDMASESRPCIPGTIVEDHSGSTVNKLVTFSRGQCFARSISVKRHQPTAGTGHAVWTRKVPKSSNAVPETMSLSEVGSPSSPCQNNGDVAVKGNISSCSAAEVAATAVPQDSSCGPGSLTSGTLYPSLESLSLARLDTANIQFSKVANKVDICDCPSPSSVLCCDDLNHYRKPCQAAHDPATNASCHSVVIGSVSVSHVVPLVDLEESCVTVSLCKDVAEVMKEIDEVPDGKHTVEKTVSFGALHENGVTQSVSHKLPERDGVLSESDPESQENNSHYTNRTGPAQLTKATLMSGGNRKGASVKMWRPVGATTSGDISMDPTETSCSPFDNDLGKLSASCSDATDNTKSALLNQRSTSKDSDTAVDNSGALNAEGELSAGTHEDLGVASSAYEETYACPLGTNVEVIAASMKQENGLIKKDSAVRSAANNEPICWSGCSPLKSVACFLSQRWTDAVTAPDSLVLSIDTEKRCPGQSCNIIADVHDGVSIVNHKDMRKISFHSGNDAHIFGGNNRKYWHNGIWKQGCTGSSVAANRRFTATDGLHLTSKSTHYRFIQK